MSEDKLVFDISQLGNLASLHAHEEQLRDQSLRFLSAERALSEQMFLVTNAMGIIFGFTHDHRTEDPEDRTLQFFGLRLFNDAGSSIKLALSGYIQQALSHTRDIMEVGFLLDYFRTWPEHIGDWRAADARIRQRKYGPRRIRDALDKRDGLKEQKRQKVYSFLSEHSTHASFSGFQLTMQNGDGQVGPFFDGDKLRAWMEELSLRLLPVAVIYGAHFLNAPGDVLRLYVSFRDSVAAWTQRNNIMMSRPADAIREAAP